MTPEEQLSQALDAVQAELSPTSSEDGFEAAAFDPKSVCKKYDAVKPALNSIIALLAFTPIYGTKLSLTKDRGRPLDLSMGMDSDTLNDRDSVRSSA